MSNRTIRILAWLFLLSWLSQMFYLFPIPDLTQWGSPDAVEAAKASGWVFTAVLIGFGLLAGVVALTKRIGIALMLASSLAYVIVWWLFSGYVDVQMPVTKMFADLWSVAKLSGRQVIFLHRDIVLNVFYHLMVLVLAYAVYRGRVRRAAA